MSTRKNLNQVFHDTVKEILANPEASDKKREILELAEGLRQKINGLIGKGVSLNRTHLSVLCGDFQNDLDQADLPSSLKEEILKRASDARSKILIRKMEDVTLDPLGVEAGGGEEGKSGESISLPESDAACLALARTLSSFDREGALKTMEKALRITRDPKITGELGGLFAFMGEYGQAFKCYKKAGAISEDPVFLKEVAEKLMELPERKYGRIVKVLAKAADISPDFRFCKGLADYIQKEIVPSAGDPKAPLLLCKRALALAKGAHEFQSVAVLLLEMEERGLAEETFGKAGDKMETYINLVSLAMELGENFPGSSVTIKVFAKAGKKAETKENAKSIAERLFAMGAVNAAKEIFTRVIELNPKGDWSSLLCFAGEMEEKGMKDVAENACDAAVSHCANLPDLKILAARVREQYPKICEKTYAKMLERAEGYNACCDLACGARLVSPSIAAEAFEKAAKGTKNSTIIEEIANEITKLGFPEKAIPLYKVAIVLQRAYFEEMVLGGEEETNVPAPVVAQEPAAPQADAPVEEKGLDDDWFQEEDDEDPESAPGFVGEDGEIREEDEEMRQPDVTQRYNIPTEKQLKTKTIVMTPAQIEFMQVSEFMHSNSPGNLHYNEVLVRLRQVAKLAVEKNDEALKGQIRQLIMTVMEWFKPQCSSENIASVISDIEKETGLKLI